MMITEMDIPAMFELQFGKTSERAVKDSRERSAEDLC